MDEADMEERRKQRVLIDEAVAEAVKVHLSNEDERRKSWHIGREIPIAVLFFLAGQTIGIAWWAATQQAAVVELRNGQALLKTDMASDKVIQLATDKRQDDDAHRAEDRIMAELRDIKQLIRK